MKGIKCIRLKEFSATLLFVLSLVSLSALSLLTSAPVKAASDYDDVIKTTDSVSLINQNENYNEDVTTSYFSKMLEKCNNLSPEILDISKWTVYQYTIHDGSNVISYVGFDYAQTDGFYLGFQDLNGTKVARYFNKENNNPTIPDGARIYYQNGELKGDCNQQNIYYPDSTYEGNADIRILLSTFDIQYPEGYAGQQIGDSVNIAPKVYPEVFYNVKQFEFSASHNHNQLKEYGLNGNSYKVKYTLYDNDSTDVLKSETIDASAFFKYTFDDYGTYGMDVEFQPKGIPYPSLPEDINFIPTKLKILVNGQSYVSNSNNDKCDEQGDCEEAFIGEDCSTYGTDLIGGFGCHIRNFGRNLEAVLIALFLPAPAFFTGYWSEFTEFLNTKLGFLYQSIASIVGLLNGVITNAASSDCTFTPAGTLWGAPMNLNLCQMQNSFPAAWAIMQSLVIGLTCFALIFAFQRRYHEAVDAR